jgi:nucleoside-diphosphate-sugar epimerase
MASKPVVICGAGGFIGGHLVKALIGQRPVRAVDIKPLGEWYQVFPEAENLVLDLRLKQNCIEAAGGVDTVYNLAADMGGMGFIENNKALCMLSVLINTHLLLAAKDTGARRFFFSSSACAYNIERQNSENVVPLKETDAYPAMPEDGYGWEKLFSERMCRHFMEDFGLETRVVRYHNVYGPCGTFDGGREKAPAAICRKVVAAKLAGSHSIEIWGDGTQRRSFTFIDDCIYGTQAILESDIRQPINIGSSELVTINELVAIVEEIAGVQLRRKYDPAAPKGVHGRNSDNTMIRDLLGWEPNTPLHTGMETTYRWIYDQMVGSARASRRSESPYAAVGKTF